MQAGDGTGSWTYSSATVRAANGSSANSITLFSGLAEEEGIVGFVQAVDDSAAPSTTRTANIGIGWNVTNAYSGLIGYLRNTPGSSDSQTFGASITARYNALPFLGIEVATACESVPSAASGITFNGTQAAMMLTTQYHG